MSPSPVLALHIVSGTVGVLTGAAALSLPKGSRWHRRTGDIFVIAMLSLALTGIGMAMVKSPPGNILGGSLTAYLVSTGWLTMRHREIRIGIFNWACCRVWLSNRDHSPYARRSSSENPVWNGLWSIFIITVLHNRSVGRRPARFGE